MIVYTNVCLACFHKKRLRQLKDFAYKNGLKLEERRTNYSKQYQVEAKTYADSVPFIVEDDKVIGLYDDLEELL